MKKKKVGIFGGTFNPPHIGHISAAKEFIEQIGLDKLIVMPAFIPPHKEYSSDVSCEDRLEMCRLAFGNMERTEISDLEIQRGGKSYTYLTLEELHSDEYDLYFLCGTDMILTIDSWRRPERIFELADICYVRRENDLENECLIEEKRNYFKRTFGKDAIPIESKAIEISSSEIRSGRDLFDHYLTAPVRDYIEKRGLYKNERS